MTILVTSYYKNSQVVVDGDRGDLAEFGKKGNTDHDFPPPLYLGGK